MTREVVYRRTGPPISEYTMDSQEGFSIGSLRHLCIRDNIAQGSIQDIEEGVVALNKQQGYIKKLMSEFVYVSISRVQHNDDLKIWPISRHKMKYLNMRPPTSYTL